MGGDAEWSADPARSLGQSETRSHAQVHGGGGDRLRYVHFRRSTDVHQECELPLSLDRLDDRSRAHRSTRMEWIPDIQHAVLAFPKIVQYQALVYQVGKLSLLDRFDWNRYLCRAHVLERIDARHDVEAIHRRWFHCLSKFSGNCDSIDSDVSNACPGWYCLFGGHVADGCESIQNCQIR